jgi:hypothetical protein
MNHQAIMQNGQLKTLELDPMFPRKPHITQADELMNWIGTQLGGTWGCVKLSGYWLIYCNGRLLTGDTLRGQNRRRDFVRALADALNVTVVQLVPTRSSK